MKKIFPLLLFFFSLACTYSGKHVVNEAPFTLAYPYIYSPPVVEKSPAPLFAYPEKKPAKTQNSALFFPFYYNPGKRNLSLEQTLGRVFYQTWAGERVFKESFFWPQNLTSKKEALNLAQTKKVDWVVIGQITYLLDGGSLTNTSLSLHLEIYSAQDQSLIWSLDHAGRLDSSTDIDWYLIKRRIVLPEDGLSYLLAQLALDLARPVKAWAQGEDFEKLILPRKVSSPSKPQSSPSTSTP